MIRRAVVDGPNRQMRVRLAEYTLEAFAEVLRRAIDGNDDGDKQLEIRN